MLVLRKMLVGKDQDRVVGERFIDCGQVGGPDGTRQVDIANLGSKPRRDRIDDYGHSDRLSPRDPRALADWITTGECVQSDELNKPVATRGSMKLRRRRQFLYLALVTIDPAR